VEGLETVILEFELVGCSSTNRIVDTVLIADNTPFYSHAGPDDTICNGDTATLSGDAEGGWRPYAYTWLTIPGHDSVVLVYPPTGSYEYILEATDACGDTQYDTMQLLVRPLPLTGSGNFSDSICSGDTILIPLVSSLPGSSFNWITYNPSGNVTGHAPGLGDTILQLLINSSLTLDSVRYSIAATADGCQGPDTSLWVYVRPTPDLFFDPVSTAVCSGQTISIALSSRLPGTSFSWTATSGNPLISGYTDDNGDTIRQTLTTTDVLPGTVVYHVTASSQSCNSPVNDYPVTVNPVPLLTTQPLFDSICSEEFTSIQLTATCPGVSFTWTTTPGTGMITGFSDGSGSVIQQQLTNHLTDPGSVLYHITPSTTTCMGGESDFTQWIKPMPLLTNSPLRDSVCSNETLNISLTSNMASATFTWTCIQGSGNIHGWSEQPTPTTSLHQTLFNSGFNIDSVTYLIVAHGEGCQGDPVAFTVVVFPVADVVFTPVAQTICSGQTTGILISSSVSGTSFSWNASGSSPDVHGYANGSGDLIRQTLTNTGYLMPTVIYLATPVANGCTGTSHSAVVTVNPLPVVSFAACFDTVTTTEAQPILLKGSNPTGGTFSGTGVSGSYFYPAIAGPGTHRIKYTYTNNFGCLDSASLSILNSQFSIFNCGDTLIDLRDSSRYPTVQIGTQCWMANNLNYGTTIASSQLQRDNCINEKYCFNDSPANCISYGGLYQWNEVMRYTSGDGAQGLCPPGWRIPSEADWNILFSFFISSGFAGNPLKAGGFSGFEALMTGTRFHNSVWKFSSSDPILRSKLYWTSTLHAPDKSWAHGMNEVVTNTEYTPSVSLYPSLHSNAFSVRCIKE